MNTTDQYLKTIYVLQRTDDSPASTGAVADRLGVSPASANEMIGKLAEHGLVEHEKYNETVVTEEDEQRARVTVETYCVIQRFPPYGAGRRRVQKRSPLDRVRT